MRPCTTSLPSILAVALTACGGNKDTVVDASPDAPAADSAVQAITVQGRTKRSDGSPHAGLTVFISGSDPVVTDAQGQFTISGVTPIPLALAAASPWTNSTSPTGRISTGPSGRYIERASRNTVDRTLCPL
jgi:hypothetical protein